MEKNDVCIKFLMRMPALDVHVGMIGATPRVEEAGWKDFTYS